MGKSTINIIVILGFITIAFAGYYFYTQQSIAGQDSVANEATTADMLNKAQAFIDYGKTLNEVNFNLAFFEDEHFRSLKSHSTPIQEHPVGRINPFSEPAIDNAALSEF